MKASSIIKKISSRTTMEGAGVELERVFANNEVPLFDPFLLLDDFRSEDPKKYIKGFPRHPHRGIETITYMLKGSVEHEDSLGNKGIISSGDVQWMTAGSGIIHQEMPLEGEDGIMYGFQLWANLPATHKMMKPRYQEIASSQIPETQIGDNVRIKVICGTVNGCVGPVKEIITDPEYLDISMGSNHEYVHHVKAGHTSFIYGIAGSAYAGDEKMLTKNRDCILFAEGGGIRITTHDETFRCLLISGKPLKEPVSWYGPIVMNSDEEIRTAFEEYENGSFIK